MSFSCRTRLLIKKADMDWIPYRLFSIAPLPAVVRKVRDFRQMFMFVYNLSIFLTSTAFVDTNTKNTAYPF